MQRKLVEDAKHSVERSDSGSAYKEDSFEEVRKLEDGARDFSDSDVEGDRNDGKQRFGVVLANVANNIKKGGVVEAEDEDPHCIYASGEGEEGEDSRLTPDEGDKSSSTPAQSRPASRQRLVSWTQEMARKSSLSKRPRKTSDGLTILPDQPLKGPDTLTTRTRIYYESTKSKLVASFILGSFSLALFGLCAIAGGKGEALYSTSLAYGDVDSSLWFNATSGNYTTIYSTEVIELAFDGQEYKDLDEDMLYTFAQAFGFACFCYLVAATLVILAAVRISPLLCGTAGEYAAITKFDHWAENAYVSGIATPFLSGLQVAKKDEDNLELQLSRKTQDTPTVAYSCNAEEDNGDEEAPAVDHN